MLFYLLRFPPSHVRIKVIYTTDGTVGATEGGTDHREYKQQEPTVWAFVRSKWVLFLYGGAVQEMISNHAVQFLKLPHTGKETIPEEERTLLKNRPFLKKGSLLNWKGAKLNEAQKRRNGAEA